MRALVLASIVALASVAGATEGEPAVVVDHARVLLSDVAPGAPKELGSIDLGAAPPPGSSVLIPRDVIVGKLGNESPKVPLAIGAVRVSSAAKVYSARQLADWLQPAVSSRLRPGVTLSRVDATVGATLSPRAVVKDITLPRTHQKGTQHVTAMVDLARDGETVLRLPLALTIEVDERGVRADVPRGSRVMVVVRAGQVEVRADATTNTDGDVGDVVQLTITRTSRAASGKLLDDKTAALLERP